MINYKTIKKGTQVDFLEVGEEKNNTQLIKIGYWSIGLWISVNNSQWKKNTSRS